MVSIDQKETEQKLLSSDSYNKTKLPSKISSLRDREKVNSNAVFHSTQSERDKQLSSDHTRDAIMLELS